MIEISREGLPRLLWTIEQQVAAALADPHPVFLVTRDGDIQVGNIFASWLCEAGSVEALRGLNIFDVVIQAIEDDRIPVHVNRPLINRKLRELRHHSGDTARLARLDKAVANAEIRPLNDEAWGRPISDIEFDRLHQCHYPLRIRQPGGVAGVQLLEFAVTDVCIRPRGESMLIILRPTEDTTQNLLADVETEQRHEIPPEHDLQMEPPEPTAWRRGDSHRSLIAIVASVFGAPATIDNTAFLQAAGYAWTVAPEVKLEIYPERGVAMLNCPDDHGCHQHHYSIGQLSVHRHGREVELCLISTSKQRGYDTEVRLRPGRMVEDTAWWEANVVDAERSAVPSPKVKFHVVSDLSGFIPVSQAAALMGISPAYVHQLARKGQLTSIKMSDKMRLISEESARCFQRKRRPRSRATTRPKPVGHQ